MLTSLSIGNFKAFGETQTIPIRPITLIFGANSSGKSSIIHSLLLAHHALANGNLDVLQPRLAGQSVDLGGFREFVHKHDSGRSCTVGFTLQCQRERSQDWQGPFKGVTVAYEFGITSGESPVDKTSHSVGLWSLSITADGVSLLRASRRGDRGLQVDEVNMRHPCFQKLLQQTEAIRPPQSTHREAQHAWELHEEAVRPKFEAVEMPEVIEDAREAWERDSAIRADFYGALAEELRAELQDTLELSNDLSVSPVRTRLERDRHDRDAEFGMLWRDLENLGNADFVTRVAGIFWHELADQLDGIHEVLRNSLESLRYLAPLRSYPPRYVIGMHDHDPNWFSGGGHAWDVLRQDPGVVAVVNRWFDILGARCQLRVRNQIDPRRVGNAERSALVRHLRTSDLAAEHSAMAFLNELLEKLAASPSAVVLSEVALIDRATGAEARPPRRRRGHQPSASRPGTRDCGPKPNHRHRATGDAPSPCHAG